MGASYRTKGKSFRTVLTALEKHGQLDAIAARVSPETAKLMHHPPLASTWMDSGPIEEVLEQLEHLEGPAGLRRLMRETTEAGGEGLGFQAVRGVLHVLGASPHAIFSRIHDLLGPRLQNVAYEWQKTGERSGVMTVSFTHGSNVHLRAYYMFVAAFELVLKLVDKRGNVGDPMRRGPNSATIAVDWT